MGSQTSAPLRPSGETTLLHTFPSAGTTTTTTTTTTTQIAQLIQYAQANYESNPTDSLLALMQALKMNSGQASADQAMERIRAELGSDVADHVLDRQGRLDRATQMAQEMLSDESTLLFQQGNQHILQQAMEDGSSVVCSKCNAMIPAARWQPHRDFWCQEAITDEDDEAKDKENQEGEELST